MANEKLQDGEAILEPTANEKLQALIESSKKRAVEIKAEKGLKTVYPIIIAGRPGEKELMLAYFGEPNFPTFSKFLTLQKTDEVTALKTLASDLFIEGDRELLDDTSVFLFGTMAQLQGIFTPREGLFVNF